MSFENTADKGGDGFMDPGSNFSSGDNRHTMGGAEIGIICGTVILFIVLVVGLFYCRKTEILRKRRATQLHMLGIGDEHGGLQMVGRTELKSGDDGARSSISPVDEQTGPRIFGAQPDSGVYTASPTFHRRGGWGWMSLRSKKSGSSEYSSHSL